MASHASDGFETRGHEIFIAHFALTKHEHSVCGFDA